VRAEERVGHERGTRKFLAIGAVADGVKKRVPGHGEASLPAEARRRSHYTTWIKHELGNSAI